MNTYLSKQAFLEKQIVILSERNLGIIVVIPCYNETGLIRSLESIKACELPKCSVEVIVVINDSEISSEEVFKTNQLAYQKALDWSFSNSNKSMHFHIIYASKLPKKHAGVGLARKIGMDEAVRRFQSVGNKRGIIVCFDADSLCFANYLTEIEKHFKETNSDACSIYFEHFTKGLEYKKEEYEAIVRYELFLRYYKQAVQFTGFPFAYHTIGSSMAVCSDTYQLYGGMNRRKAGEDFYFLQKLIPYVSFTELTTTTVIPSPRVSDRVPFGTGKAVGEWISLGELGYGTYDFSIFTDLKCFIERIHVLYDCDDIQKAINQLPKSIADFLLINGIEEVVCEIRKNVSGVRNFEKRFYGWFNAFKVLKYVHFARDNHYSNAELLIQCKRLLETLIKESKHLKSYADFLEMFRACDKKIKESSTFHSIT